MLQFGLACVIGLELGFLFVAPRAEALAVAATIGDAIEVVLTAHRLLPQVIREFAPLPLDLDPAFVALTKIDEQTGLLVAEGAERSHSVFIPQIYTFVKLWDKLIIYLMLNQ